MPLNRDDERRTAKWSVLRNLLARVFLPTERQISNVRYSACFALASKRHRAHYCSDAQ